MSWYIFNKVAVPAAPAANKLILFEDTTDKKLKTIDESGVINVLVNDGLDQNLIINGGFDFAQRQVPTTLTTYSSVGGRVYGPDRWWISNETASTQFGQVDTNSAPEAGLQARNYGKFKKTAAIGKVAIGQVIEATNTEHARGLTVRFTCKMKFSVAAAMTVRLGLVQLTAAGTVDIVASGAAGYISAWGAAGVDPTLTVAANIAYIAPVLADGGTIVGTAMNCVLTNQWVRYSATFVVPATCKNIIPMIWTNGQLAVNDELNISECIFAVGQEIRDWTPLHTDKIFTGCLRYYQKSFPILIAPAQNAGVTGMVRSGVATAGGVPTSSIMHEKFTVPMRVLPSTITFYNPSAANAFMRNIPAGTDATATSAANATNFSMDINCTGLAAWSSGNQIGVHYTVDAEL